MYNEEKYEAPEVLMTDYTYAAPEQLKNVLGKSVSDLWSLGWVEIIAPLTKIALVSDQS